MMYVFSPFPPPLPPQPTNTHTHFVSFKLNWRPVLSDILDHGLFFFFIPIEKGCKKKEKKNNK